MGFPGLDAHALLVRLDEVGICASAGSACHSGAFEPSHVLSAMGLTSDEAASCIRFSLSAMTTDEDIAYCTERSPASSTNSAAISFPLNSRFTQRR